MSCFFISEITAFKSLISMGGAVSRGEDNDDLTLGINFAS
jgi:hypothetical protein